MDASERDATCETEIFLVMPLNRTNAPSPDDANHRRDKAGELATPTTTSCVPSAPTSTSAIKQAQVGTPRIKFFVPSIGSIIQYRFAPVMSLPNSSPNKPSLGRCVARASRIAVSTARSASVTGVLSGLVVITRSKD